MIVPVLTLWLAAPFRRAVGTSLVIIGLTGIAALASHLRRRRPARRRRDRDAGLRDRRRRADRLAVAHRAPTALLRRAFAVIVATVAVALLVDVLFLGGPPT